MDVNSELLEKLYLSTREISKKLDRIENGQIRLEEANKNHARSLEYLDKLVWRGGEVPALVQQVAVLNQKLQDNLDANAAQFAKLEKSISNRNQILITIFTALVTGVLGFALNNYYLPKEAVKIEEPVQALTSADSHLNQ